MNRYHCPLHFLMCLKKKNVHNHLTHCFKHGIPDTQHGFMSGWSVETNLVCTFEMMLPPRSAFETKLTQCILIVARHLIVQIISYCYIHLLCLVSVKSIVLSLKVSARKNCVGYSNLKSISFFLFFLYHRVYFRVPILDLFFSNLFDKNIQDSTRHTGLL